MYSLFSSQNSNPKVRVSSSRQRREISRLGLILCFHCTGAVGNSGLVSPEAEVLTSPAVVNLMNGLLSLLKYGLDSAFGKNNLP